MAIDIVEIPNLKWIVDFRVPHFKWLKTLVNNEIRAGEPQFLVLFRKIRAGPVRLNLIMITIWLWLVTNIAMERSTIF